MLAAKCGQIRSSLQAIKKITYLFQKKSGTVLVMVSSTQEQLSLTMKDITTYLFISKRSHTILYGNFL